MTDGLPRAEVAQRLDAVEAEDDVRVVYAVESGSRAWGFASADSDVDVRFLYVHRPAWYLGLGKRRDVIERPITDEIDLSGWDLRKALGLFYKSNPPLYEWLRSPLVYREAGATAAEMRALVPAFYDPKAGFHHYLHMAEGNYRAELTREPVRHKKYLYVLRPVLACRWIDAERSDPPMELSALVKRFLPADGPDASARADVEALLAEKRAGREADAGPRRPALHAYLDRSLADLRARVGSQPKPARDLGPLDALFVQALRAVWPDDPVWTPPAP